MIEIKKRMLRGLVEQLSSFDLYTTIDTYGKDIFEQFIDIFREEIPKVKLNKRTVDYQLGPIFKVDVEGRWGPSDASTYRCMHNYHEGLASVMYNIYMGEIKRRVRLALGDDLNLWKEIENHTSLELNSALVNLSSRYLEDKFQGSYRGTITKVEQSKDIDEYIYSEMFRLVSEHLKEKNSAEYGFSFSDSLICAAPVLIGKKKKYGKGRRPTRHAMVHLCPALTMPERLMIRPINDMSKPPAFFCKHCKEKLTKAHKTVWKLIMLGRKL